MVARTIQPVMKIDSRNSSRPLIIQVTDPDEISQAFDTVLYDKVNIIFPEFLLMPTSKYKTWSS